MRKALVVIALFVTTTAYGGDYRTITIGSPGGDYRPSHGGDSRQYDRGDRSTWERPSGAYYESDISRSYPKPIVNERDLRDRREPTSGSYILIR